MWVVLLGEGGGVVMMYLMQVEGWWSLAGCEEGGRRWLGVVFDWVDQGSTFDPWFYYKGVGLVVEWAKIREVGFWIGMDWTRLRMVVILRVRFGL